MAEAVARIDAGTAPRITQPEEGASYEPMLNTKEAARIKFGELGAHQLHDFIRGCDKVPGAWMCLEGMEVKCYGSTMWREELPKGDGVSEFLVEGMHRSALVHSGGMILFGLDNKGVNITKLGLPTGKMIVAAKYGQVRSSRARSNVV